MASQGARPSSMPELSWGGLAKAAAAMAAPPAGKAPWAVVGTVMTVLLTSDWAARMPLEGGVMGSKRPLSTRVGTVLLTGVSSTPDRSRTSHAWHRLLMAWLLAAWSLESSG